jgi:hypothetical protein
MIISINEMKRSENFFGGGGLQTSSRVVSRRCRVASPHVEGWLTCWRERESGSRAGAGAGQLRGKGKRGQGDGGNTHAHNHVGGKRKPVGVVTSHLSLW